MLIYRKVTSQCPTPETGATWVYDWLIWTGGCLVRGKVSINLHIRLPTVLITVYPQGRPKYSWSKELNSLYSQTWLICPHWSPGYFWPDCKQPEQAMMGHSIGGYLPSTFGQSDHSQLRVGNPRALVVFLCHLQFGLPTSGLSKSDCVCIIQFVMK